MRIQHNIMAMNAYRNYNTNTSALAKNLEKLSSGYRINRAGDDAAGLAISEKMRAQITGLDAAQKNVKDGISLVKTAEGAMQEIHDMLGRMKYLATQSSNGTYDNEVDRKNLQKEVESLKSEINRIADSANFNGQKLLNGALDAGADFTVHGSFTAGKNLPGVGQVLGTNTVLETANKPAQGTEFSIDLHNIEFSNKQGEALTIQIGDKILTMRAGEGDIAADTKMTTQDIVTALTTGKFTDQDGKKFTGTDLTFGGQQFDVTANGTRVTFKQTNAPTKASEVVDGRMKVTITGGAAKKADLKVTGATTGTNGFTANGSATVAADAKASYTATADVGTGTQSMQFTGKKEDGTTLTIKMENITAGDPPAKKAQDFVDKLNGDADFNKVYTAKIENGKIVIEALKARQGDEVAVQESNAATFTGTTALAGTKVSGAEAGHTLTIGGANLNAGKKFTINGKTYEMAGAVDWDNNKFSNFNDLKTMLAKDNIEISSSLGTGHELDANAVLTFKNFEPKDADKSLTGDYNVSTDVITAGHDKSSDRLASTAFKLTKEMINEGGNIRIGEDTYNFVKTGSGAGGAAGANEVVIGDLDPTAADYLSTVAERLTKAAAGNKTYTVGHDGDRMTFTENQAYKNLAAADKKYDLSTLKGVENSFAWNGANQTGAALNLQIGDSSKDYDQLAVSVKDVHTKALGIDDLDISTQVGAHEAIDKIMDAINTVSSTRGDLGAIQNRLEHTEKNLSVMQESIQDAESAIRDTDVAAEMMKYTKNNILIQSAQAMLAQANQVPQGVLQLLQ